MGKSLLKTQTVNNESFGVLTISKEMQYKTMTVIEIKDMFSMAIANGKLITDNLCFEDKKWKYVGRLLDKVGYLSFSELSNETENKVKSYSLCILNKFSAETALSYTKAIIKILAITNEFSDYNEKSIYQLEEIKLGKATYSSFEDFLSFADIDMKKTRKAREILKRNIIDDSTRILPSFQSILIFDNIIKDFISNKLDDFPEFYIIVLWWELTMIIPMRPVEFLTIKAQDIYKRGSEYFIKINRSLKSDPENIRNHPVDLMTEFPINKYLYNLFQAYIKTITIKREGYIFNSDRYKFVKKREFIGRSAASHILNKFYDEIVSREYGYVPMPKNNELILNERKIEKINFGDTRHLAFLNLIISGYNPYTIAQMGGHRNLESQMSYYSGATSYCTSKALALSLGLSNIDVQSLSINEWRTFRIKQEEAKHINKRKVHGGYCICQNFPYDCCYADCSDGQCVYFLEDDFKNTQEKIQNKITELNKNIELLKMIVFTEPKSSAKRIEIKNNIDENIKALTCLLRNERLEEV